MANDVKVVIELSKASPRAGFGMPLILAGMHSKAVEYKEVSGLDEVVAAGFAESDAVYKAAALLFMQNDAPSIIAVCASTSPAVAALPALLKENWRQLVVCSAGVEGESSITEIAAYIESCDKNALYFASVDPDADSTVIEAVKGKERTILLAYESDDVACPEAAVVGATSGMAAGSFTYKNIILKGVTAQSYSDAEITDLHEDGVITILYKAGSVVTSEGFTMSGEYADIIDAKDYIIEQIEFQCQTLLNRVPKLAYTNEGISAIESVVYSVLKDAANNGMVAVDEDGDYLFEVNFQPRQNCAATDISARRYVDGGFEFVLAGAIHTAKISGTITA